jgi:hypothetical protein
MHLFSWNISYEVITLRTRDDDNNDSFWEPKVKDTSNCYAFGSRLGTVFLMIILGSVVGGKERRVRAILVCGGDPGRHASYEVCQDISCFATHDKAFRYVDVNPK